jgi:HK97 family phage prohead protease
MKEIQMNKEIKTTKDFKTVISSPLTIKSFDDKRTDYFFFEGFASTFNNMDYDMDVILPGAFKNSLNSLKRKKEQLPILWQHDRKEPIGIFQHDRKEPIGIFSEIEENDEGLFVTGQMPWSDSFVKTRVIPQIKVGSIKSMSIGFSVIDYEIDEHNNYIIYYLKELDLREISLVTMPANPKAIITDLKAEDFKTKDERSLEKILTKGVKCSNNVAKTIISSLKTSGYRDESNK